MPSLTVSARVWMGEEAGEVTYPAATRTHGPQWEGRAIPSHPRTATVCLSLLAPAQFTLFGSVCFGSLSCEAASVVYSRHLTNPW